MHVKTLIVGAGPAGLACARILAEHGHDVLVLERKHAVGNKVCAGGITYTGLVSRVPDSLVEQAFRRQYVQTTYQRCHIEEEKPIIATVNRQRLGLAMAEQARAHGATIHTGIHVRKITANSAHIQHKEDGTSDTISFDYLVGADGSASLVRRHLDLTSDKLGVGINYMVPGHKDNMEWHLDHKRFANGYAWIFPHSDSVSVGAYAPKESMSPALLKQSLLEWAAAQGISLDGLKAQAEYINFDYKGWKIGNTFLAGDAAGLASGLTGEGIYPAIVSGEEIAATILNPDHDPIAMTNLIKRHRQHSTMVALSGKSGVLCTLLSELMTLGLRSGIVKFSQMEMAV